MKTTKKILFTSILLIIFISKSFSQVSVSFYNSSLSKLGVAYNFNDKIWSELRIYSNTYFYEITPELVFNYNFIHNEKFNVYAGIGGVVNYYSGLVIPVGVQFTPFDKFDRFSLHIECQPTFDFNDDFILQSSWGIRYKFKK